LTFSGTPLNDDVGIISIEVSVTDDKNGTAVTDSFDIVISNTNDLPNGEVTISGIATEDETLMVNTDTLADDDGLGLLSYQWLRDGVNISGATASSYTLIDDDVGGAISVTVSYTDTGGQLESISSVDTEIVSNINDQPTGVVSITGSASLDEVLTVNNNLADDDGLSSISYQWQRDGIDITGETGTTYTLVTDDIGNTINVVASYTDLNNTVESVSSIATAIVTAFNNGPEGSVSISGAEIQGETLTVVSNLLEDDDGLGVFSYQWLRDGVNISDAINENYQLSNDDVGALITVEISYTDGNGTAESIISSATETVINVNDPPSATELNQTHTYIEGAVSIALNDIVITDVDIDETLTATLTLSDTSSGYLSSGSFGNSTSSYNNETGVWTVSGTASDVNQALAAVLFHPAIDNDFNTTITTHIEDIAGSSPSNGIISLNVIPVNDTATVSSDAQVISEDDGAILTANGTVMVSDIDTGEAFAQSQTGIVGNYGTFSVTNDGDWTYAADNSQTVIQALNLGDSLVDSFTVVSNDGSASNTVTITINGVNDSAMVSAASVVLTETDEVLNTSGSLTSTDVDNADNTFTASHLTGMYGDFTIGTTGAWTYTANQIFDSLSHGQVISEQLTVTSVDGTESTVTIQINGSNDDPRLENSIVDQIATEDSPFSFTFSTDVFSDIDTDDNLIYSAQLLGGGDLPTWLNFNSESLGFSGTPLNDDVGILSIEVIADDGNGGIPATDSFDLTIANVNDITTGTILVTGSLVEGAVLTADTTSIADDDGLGVLAFQWQKDGNDIAGATTSSYVVAANDISSNISVNVSYVDNQGTFESINSVEIVAASEEIIEPTEDSQVIAESEIVEIIEEIEEVIDTQDIFASIDFVNVIEEQVEEQVTTSDNEKQAIQETSEEEILEGEVILEASRVDNDLFQEQMLDIAYLNTVSIQVMGNNGKADISWKATEGKAVEENQPQINEREDNYLAYEDPLLLIQTTNFIKGLDDMRQDISQDLGLNKTVVGSSLAVSAGVSAGYVAWLARSGVLLSSVMSTLPVWRFIDPLPILDQKSGALGRDDESLESIVADGTNGHKGKESNEGINDDIK